MEGLLPQGWGEFGVGAAGATAALAGLLIVAISVNVKEILASRVAIRGASSTIASLVLALVASLVVLVPGQALRAVGIELLVALAPAVALQVRSLVVAAAIVLVVVASMVTAWALLVEVLR